MKKIVDDLKQTRGLIATVCLSGTVLADFATALSNMRSYHDRNGWYNIEYQTFHAVLVERGRDAAAAHALQQGYDWLLQVDADAAPFGEQALTKLLHTAYIEQPHLHAVGAYCQLTATTPANNRHRDWDLGSTLSASRCAAGYSDWWALPADED